jgi:cytochrome c biogenesis protein CcmG/thiol:disulfide interchange protein DsbE
LRKQVLVILAAVILTGWAVYQNSFGSRPSPADAKDSPANSTTAAQRVEVLPKAGFTAPGFTLADFNGKEYILSQNNEKPVVVNFWASWCGPCRLEAPELVKLYAAYKDRVEIYAVNLTTQDRVDEAKAFAEEYGFEFPVLLDKDIKDPVANRYRIQAIPTTFFIDKNGLIVDKVIGLASPQTLADKFKKLAASY